MRLLFALCAALLLPAAAHAQLNGTYTVGGASPDYATLTDAVNDLNALGISGPVFFHIRPGTYDEQVTITSFPRFGDPDDAVTFTRPSPNDPRPTWRFSAAGLNNNWVVRLNGADHVILQGIAFEAAGAVNGRLVVFENGADHNIVRNCTLEGILGASSNRGSLIYGKGTRNEHNTFETNTLSYGYRGIELESASAGDRASGNAVVGNTIGGQYEGGVYLRFQLDAVVDGNAINDAAWSNFSAYVALFVDGGGAAITANTVEMQGGAVGIQLQSAGVSDQRLIANNLINARGSTDAGIVLTTGLVDVYHNTIRVGSILPDATALRVNSGTLTGVHLRNNLLVNDGGGYALRAPVGTNIASSDYNDLYTTGAWLVQWDGINLASLANYQTASGLDAHSVSEAVTFVDVSGSADLHLAGASLDDLDLIGTPVASVTVDVDGDARDAYNPKMGADEGTPLPPLDNADVAAGFYAVAGSAPDFANPAEAFRHLDRRGMKGAVTFRIRAGTFPLHHELTEADRIGPAAVDPAGAPFLVRAANPSNPPVLRHAATTPANNFLLQVTGFDHLTLENLVFESTSAGPYGRLVVIADDADDVTVLGCTFTGLAATTGDGTPLYAATNLAERLRVEGSTFTGGYDGLRTGAGSVPYPEGHVYAGNTLDGQYNAGIFASGVAAVITENTVSSDGTASTSYTGIHGLLGGGESVVTRNRVNVDRGARGIYLGLTSDKLVANNMVSMHTPHGEAGIYLDTHAINVELLHNTVRVGGSNGAGVALYKKDVASGGGNVELWDNLLVNTADGVVLDVEDPAEVDSSDYNDLHTTGATLVDWGGTAHATLASYQLASGLDAHSVSVPVTFVAANAGDLHLAGASDDDPALLGTPVGITEDLDGDARDPDAPRMGADEGLPIAPPNYDLEAEATSPLTVAAGGSVSFAYSITNNTGSSVSGDLYFTASGGYRGVIVSGSLGGGQTFDGTFTQNVPGNTPPGVYDYTLRIGQYPNGSVDEVPFQITVTAAPRVARGDDEAAPEAWTVTDATPWPALEAAAREAEETAPEVGAASALPEAFALHAASPNPFAGQTTLRYDLPAAAEVTVEVLDLLGRRVAVLVEAAVEAGTHAVAFDGSSLPSGVYLVRMRAGTFAAVQRLTHVR